MYLANILTVSLLDLIDAHTWQHLKKPELKDLQAFQPIWDDYLFLQDGLCNIMGQRGISTAWEPA